MKTPTQSLVRTLKAICKKYNTTIHNTPELVTSKDGTINELSFEICMQPPFSPVTTTLLKCRATAISGDKECDMLCEIKSREVIVCVGANIDAHLKLIETTQSIIKEICSPAVIDAAAKSIIHITTTNRRRAKSSEASLSKTHHKLSEMEAKIAIDKKLALIGGRRTDVLRYTQVGLDFNSVNQYGEIVNNQIIVNGSGRASLTLNGKRASQNTAILNLTGQWMERSEFDKLAA